MTDQSSSITPPPELVRQWFKQAHESADPDNQPSYYDFIATAAAHWGWDQRGTINETQLQERADEELKACCLLLDDGEHAASYGFHNGDSLYAARRPKPPSLKEQAIAELEKVDMLWDTTEFNQDTLDSLDTIRRALEAMPND